MSAAPVWDSDLVLIAPSVPLDRFVALLTLHCTSSCTLSPPTHNPYPA